MSVLILILLFNVNGELRASRSVGITDTVQTCQTIVAEAVKQDIESGLIPKGLTPFPVCLDTSIFSPGVST